MKTPSMCTQPLDRGFALSLSEPYAKKRYYCAINLSKELQMARKCAISGKGPMAGNNVSHAKNRTKRRFLPNLRTIRVTLEDGTTRKVKVSASELRTMKKNS